jgi:hypothetical protein
VIRLLNRRCFVIAALCAILVIGLVAQVPLALAEDGETPGGNGDLLNSLIPPSEGGNSTQVQPTITNEQAGTTGTPSAAANGNSDSGASTAASTNTTGTGWSGPAIIPAVTPLVVEEYSTQPAQLESGSRFTLTLKITNHGTDDADGVVVRIGPSADKGWGSGEEFAVLGGGSARFVGPIKAGASDDTASFQLIANPAIPGGLRSVPVQITWKSGTYEHTSSQAVGLLVNSYVALDASFITSAPAVKEPFGTELRIRNLSGRPVKDVCVVFDGKGARPSRQTTITVGDLAPGAVGNASTKFTAPLVGRAQLLATVSYVDDFGDRRSVQVEAWAHVTRTAPQAEETSSRDVFSRAVLVVAALFGLSG